MFFDNLSWSVLNANGNTANLDEHLDGADLRWKRAKDVSICNKCLSSTWKGFYSINKRLQVVLLFTIRTLILTKNNLVGLELVCHYLNIVFNHRVSKTFTKLKRYSRIWTWLTWLNSGMGLEPIFYNVPAASKNDNPYICSQK